MKIIEAKALLISFIENAITDRYYGDDDEATYTAYEIALDKLKQGIPLCTMECKMFKSHILKFADACKKSLDEQEVTAMKRVAEML